MNFLKLKLYRIFHWEYWPFEVIYYPIFPVWFFFAVRAKSFFFFNAANPSIKNGGMAMESKMDIYDMIPKKVIPKTLLVTKGTPLSKIKDSIASMQLSFPIIAKPDIGMKALGVEKIEDEAQLGSYAKRIHHDFLVQELITYPKEIGIFYVRFPHEPKGRITGIVSKEFLSVTGDGQHTIKQLIVKNPRSHFQLKQLKKKYGNRLETVLGEGEEFILVPYGSHTRGAKFIDDSGKISPKLTQLIDDICLKLPDFHYGRLDIKHSSFEELENGNGFSIIEINGAGSEPTHIYDPKHSIFFAWKEIIRHWNMLFQISRINKEKGFPYLSYSAGRTMLRENSILEKHLKLI